MGGILLSFISWAERANLFRWILNWDIAVWNNIFMSLFMASMLALEKHGHIQDVCEECGCVAFTRACHESVSKSVWTVCWKDHRQEETRNPVSLYALKLGMQTGLIFACCSSLVFSIRGCWTHQQKGKQYVFTEGRVERRKMFPLII